MRDRVLGPYRGYYLAATCLLMGELGNRYKGWGKLFTYLPDSTLSPREILSVHSAFNCRTVEGALDDVEDLLVQAADELPDLTPAPVPSPRLDCLVYVSKAKEAIPVGELQHMLSRARERNEQFGITGMLLYFDETFMQYIEGPAHHVQLIYRIIRCDPMHGGLIKFVKQPITKRAFGGWSMAFGMPGAELWLPVEQQVKLEQGFDATAAHAMLAAFLTRDSVDGELIRSRLIASKKSVHGSVPQVTSTGV